MQQNIRGLGWAKKFRPTFLTLHNPDFKNRFWTSLVRKSKLGVALKEWNLKNSAKKGLMCIGRRLLFRPRLHSSWISKASNLGQCADVEHHGMANIR